MGRNPRGSWVAGRAGVRQRLSMERGGEHGRGRGGRQGWAKSGEGTGGLLSGPRLGGLYLGAGSGGVPAAGGRVHRSPVLQQIETLEIDKAVAGPVWRQAANQCRSVACMVRGVLEPTSVS